MYEFATYNHIQYHGFDYYMTEDQHHPYLNFTEERIDVYLVDTKSKVDYMHSYQASGYEGDKEHIYIFFDGAVYIRSDYLNYTPSKDTW
jgi:hypothetical protein